MWAAIPKLMLIAGLCSGVPVIPRMTAQQTQPPATEEESETFSGTVVELSTGKVTVARSILGSAAEKRTFLLKSETRIEGHMRTKARVTVGFITTPEGDVARLIVVREKQKKP